MKKLTLSVLPLLIFIFAVSNANSRNIASVNGGMVNIKVITGKVYNLNNIQGISIRLYDSYSHPYVMYASVNVENGTYRLENVQFPSSVSDGIKLMAYANDAFERPRAENEPPKPLAQERLRLEDVVNGQLYQDIGLKTTGEAESFSLKQNYPNPFNPSTVISFSVPVSSSVSLKVYDMEGKEVSSLINNEVKAEGLYNVEFNASAFPSGVYYYRLTAGSFTEIKKMTLVK